MVDYNEKLSEKIIQQMRSADAMTVINDTVAKQVEAIPDKIKGQIVSAVQGAVEDKLKDTVRDWVQQDLGVSWPDQKDKIKEIVLEVLTEHKLIPQGG